MENQNNERKHKYDFLEQEEVKSYFADINIELLRGKHIQSEDFYAYNIIENYYEGLTYYYQELYSLRLIRDKKDNHQYFYLDFPPDKKGKLYHSDRHKELSEQQTIVGIILLKMYYEMYFHFKKEVTWDMLKEEIMSSELKEQYQRVFFGEVRPEYTDKEWDDQHYKTGVKNKFEKTLKSFAELGWISWLNKDEMHFEINTSIHRLAELYKNEIANFEEFSKSIEDGI